MSITWREVAAPDFRGAAVIAGSANEAINNSIKGITGAFDRFGQQFVDKDTNAAIKASMGLNSIDTLEADRAALVAGMGQDVDVTKLNQILQQRAEALQGAETFRRSGLTHDLGMQKGAQDITLGQQNIDSGIAAALRQPVLNNQADELFSLNKQKGQLEVDYLPTEQRNKTAESRASVNQSNASAGQSNSGTRLNNLNIGKLEQSIKDETRINAAADRVSAAFIAGKQANSNYSWQDAINVVDKDATVSGAEKVLVLDRANTMLGIDKQSKAEDADADRLIKKSTAKFQDKSVKDAVIDGIVNSVDTTSFIRPGSYDKAFRDQLNSSVRMMINAGMSVPEAEANFIEISKSRGNFGGEDYVKDAKVKVDAFNLKKAAALANKK